MQCKGMGHAWVIEEDVWGIPSVSNSFAPDQTQHFVRPDLGQNCSEKDQQTTKVVINRHSGKDFTAILTRVKCGTR